MKRAGLRQGLDPGFQGPAPSVDGGERTGQGRDHDIERPGARDDDGLQCSVLVLCRLLCCGAYRPCGGPVVALAAVAGALSGGGSAQATSVVGAGNGACDNTCTNGNSTPAATTNGSGLLNSLVLAVCPAADRPTSAEPRPPGRRGDRGHARQPPHRRAGCTGRRQQCGDPGTRASTARSHRFTDSRADPGSARNGGHVRCSSPLSSRRGSGAASPWPRRSPGRRCRPG